MQERQKKGVVNLNEFELPKLKTAFYIKEYLNQEEEKLLLKCIEIYD